MKRVKWRCVLAPLVLFGCHSAPVDEAPEYLRIAPTIQDDPANQLLRLTYTNDSGSKLCLFDWPSRGGIIQNNGSEIFLTVGDDRYFLQKERDLCPKGCRGPEVSPGQRIDGVVPYRLFGLPEHRWREPKAMSAVTFGAETCSHGWR